MSDVLITVVVPAYNVAEFILPCLASVVAQTHANWHCVVVDDGSGDDTAARVGSVDDNRITLLRQANAGVSAARNCGLAHARGDHVMFLDGDDVLHDRALARLAAVLANRPRAVAAYGTFLKILPDGTPYPGQKPLARHRYADGDVLETMVRGNFLANGGHVLIRTAAARSIGGFDTAIRLSEDWEFWCRLAACGEFAFRATARDFLVANVNRKRVRWAGDRVGQPCALPGCHRGQPGAPRTLHAETLEPPDARYAGQRDVGGRPGQFHCPPVQHGTASDAGGLPPRADARRLAYLAAAVLRL